MSKKNIIIIILSVLLLIAVGIIIFLMVKPNQDKFATLTGKVIVTDDKYVIIEGEDEDFLVTNIKGKYNLGDKVKITYKISAKKEQDPVIVPASDEELMEVAITNDNNSTEANVPNNTPSDANTNSNNSSNNSQNSSVNNSSNGATNNNTSNKPSVNQNSNTSNNSSNNIDADTAVLNYFNDYQTKIDQNKITDTLKSGFVTIVDFLFYDGTISGHTFKELSDTVKLKVLAMALYFDGKIEKYFPGYKESISNTTSKVYTTIKEKVISSYLTITTSICNNNSTLCENAKAGFGELKKNFSLTWELLKDIAGDGLTNLKNWYEIWRES